MMAGRCTSIVVLHGQRLDRGSFFSMNDKLNYEALSLVVERCDGSKLGKQLLLKRLWKKYKEGRLSFQKMDRDWRWRLCNARMMLGHYDWDGWELRSDWAANAWHNRPTKGPMWDGKPTEHLYLFGEQGLGDEILFSQCIPDAIKALGHSNITAEVDERLHTLYERSFGIKCRARGGLTDDKPGMTAWLCMGDLPRLFRPPWNGKPYLVVDPARVPEMEQYRGLTCVSWKGNHGHYEPERFGMDGWVDVQYNEHHPRFIQPHFDKRNDIEGLLALLSVSAQLVSVSTTVVHLAAAIGCHVDLVLAPGNGKNADQLHWRWELDRDRTRWYDSVRIWRNYTHYANVHLRHTKNRDMPRMGTREQLATHRNTESALPAG